MTALKAEDLTENEQTMVLATLTWERSDAARIRSQYLPLTRDLAEMTGHPVNGVVRTVASCVRKGALQRSPRGGLIYFELTVAGRRIALKAAAEAPKSC